MTSALEHPTLTTQPRQLDETVLRGAARTDFDYASFDHSNIPFEEEEFPVIIIGSSMVGMSLGILLGYCGIKSLSFDRHPSTATHPRAALFLLRTIEIFRQLGLADILQKESKSNFDLDAGMLIVEKLVGGKVLARFQEADPVETAKVTPVSRLWLTQDAFEPLLHSRGADFGAVQKFSTRVVHYEEQHDGVVVVVQDVGTSLYSKYKTQYLVACDGNRSPVRRAEGIEWEGPGVQGNNLSINFNADLTPYLGVRAVHGVTYINNPKIGAGFRLEGGGKKGFMIVTKTADRSDFAPDSVTAEEAKRFFFDASGIEDDLPVEVESISYWTAAAYNCERYASKGGRVFLAGDSAHVVPPTGGMGGNTGIQDTYNLAWKLSFVIKGWASPSLLQSYSEERQPVVRNIMEQAFARYVNRVSVDKTIEHEQELPDIMCELGYRYVKGALVPSRAERALEAWEDPYQPMVIAGSRMPHVPLVDVSKGDAALSTLDLVKQNFLLITTDESSAWMDAAQSQSIPVDVYVISEQSYPIRDRSSRVKELFRMENGLAVLVRPDGYIAWRGLAEGSDPKTTLETVLKQVLWK